MAQARWKPFVHPVALAVLLLTGILAVAVQAWAPWSGRAGWVIAWGLLGYGTAVLAAAIPWRAATSTSSTTTTVTVGAGRVDTMVMPEDLVLFTEEALRRLNDLAALATCALAARIPHTLSDRNTDGATAPSTPLEVARVLREVMVDGIERLKPATRLGTSSPGEAEVLRYAILHEEYVLGRPNHQIMTRHNVSESTFHRYRRVGTRALATELARRELLLASDVKRI